MPKKKSRTFTDENPVMEWELEPWHMMGTYLVEWMVV